MKEFKHKVFNQEYVLKVEKTKYADGNLAVKLIDTQDGFDFAVVSINIPEEADKIEDNEFVFKTYSENEGLLEKMIDEKIVEVTDRYVMLSHNIVPVVKLLI